jgi:hypothetical protein
MYPEGDYLEDPVAKKKLQATQKSPFLLPIHALTLLSSLSFASTRGIVALLQSFSSQCPVVVNPLDYICFYSLRAWDVLKGRVMTEEIYVRSKVLHVTLGPC